MCLAASRKIWDEWHIAFEYAAGQPEWWYDIVEGLPDPIVKNGFIDVDSWDKPGLGLTFNVQAAKKYLREDDREKPQGSFTAHGALRPAPVANSVPPSVALNLPGLLSSRI